MPRSDRHEPSLADRRRFLAVLGGLSAGVFMMGCSSDDGDDTSGGGVPSTTSSASGTTVDPVAGDPYVQAFFAGLPLVTTVRTMQTFAPLTKINQAFVSPGLTRASTRLVIAPNHDTVYVLAVLDLDAGPVRIDLPAITDRYHVVQILDAWMGSAALLGTRVTGGKAGTWVVRKEGDKTPAPDGVEVVTCDTRHAFVLGRIRAVDDADAVEAVAVAQGVTIAPLVAPVGASDDLGAAPGPPQEVGQNGVAFFDELSQALALEDPVTDDQRQALAAVADAIGPGRTPSTVAALQEPLGVAVENGMGLLARGLSGSGQVVNGWRINLDLGREDDRQSLQDRAVISRYFWGPVPAEEAVYPKAETASDGLALTGDKRYRITLAGDALPPVDAFWSVTAYAEDLFLYDNAQNRYALSGDTPGLAKGADGSIEILLQHDEPTDGASNWIPVPEGPFHLILRLYLPQKAILDGTWKPPPVEVVTG